MSETMLNFSFNQGDFMPDINVTIKIPSELKEVLEEIAKKEDRSLSSLLRRVLNKHLESPEIAALLKERKEM